MMKAWHKTLKNYCVLAFVVTCFSGLGCAHIGEIPPTKLEESTSKNICENATTSNDIAKCRGYEAQKLSQTYLTEYEAVAAKLPRLAKSKFHRALELSHLVKLAEGKRMYQAYIEGTIRGTASVSHEMYVAQLINEFVRESIVAGKLNIVSREELAKIELQRQSTYLANINSYVSIYENNLKEQSLKEYWPTYKGYIHDYKDYAKKSQIAWENMQSAWALFAGQYFKGKYSSDDIESSIKYGLNQMRMKHLEFNPLGPA